MTGRPLRAVSGGRHRGYLLGAVSLVASPRHDPPFSPEVRVLEEDTWRLLSAPAEVAPEPEHPVRLMTSLIDDRPAPPGSVLVNAQGWRAVVYDLDQDPICREEWVEVALRNLLAEAARRRCRTLALPLLGCGQCALSSHRVLALVVRTLAKTEPGCTPPLRLWLQIPPELREAVSAALSQLVENHSA